MKTKRHLKILELIQSGPVETQEELAALLKAHGYQVTQATVSRDIRELNLTKVADPYGSGKQRYSVMNAAIGENIERFVRVFIESVVSMDIAQNLLVIKTLSGMGMAVALAIDNMNNEEVVGTIAGDDTVFSAVRSHEEAVRLLEKLNRLVKE